MSSFLRRIGVLFLFAAFAVSILSGCVKPIVAIQQTAPAAESEKDKAAYVRKNYEKREYQVPMRDGVMLFTVVYSPMDTSQTYPMLMMRTPYSVGPYGEDAYKEQLGPGWHFTREKYIFVYQDVRGCFMSEGTFNNMTPHVAKKESPADIDESSDTYDTIEWLVANVENHNGKVGQYGISYPGFYTAAGMIDAHPSLVAVSPQAPIADWYWDDFHHHGALFLPHTFNFFATFGRERPRPTSEWGKPFEHGTPDGYQFFLDLGPLKNVNEKYYKGEIAFWNDAAKHPNYDSFWQERNLLPHLNNVKPAVMTVGGWYDAEDLYGPLKIYEQVERRNPGTFNILVMGPWAHGGWSRGDGDKLGTARFDAKTSLFFREHIELPFFHHFLKGGPSLKLPEAYMFETGANKWRTFDRWPPVTSEQSLFVQENGALSFDKPTQDGPAFDEYVSDPTKPVPFTQAISKEMTREYMTDDQRFAARRPDVVVYQTEPLEEDMTLAGPMIADLWVSTSGTDSDWIVKVIDVFPGDVKEPEGLPAGVKHGGYQMLVRGEVFRGRFRESYEKPIPFTPNEPTQVRFELLDVLHTFKKDHRVMVQIQSTWFPLVDRNPQKFVDNIFEAEESDFIRATQRVHRSEKYPTRVVVQKLTDSTD